MQNKEILLEELAKLSIKFNSHIKALDDLIQLNEQNNNITRLAKDKFTLIALRTEINNLRNDLNNFDQLDSEAQKKIITKLKNILNKINSTMVNPEIPLAKFEQSKTQSSKQSFLTAAKKLSAAIKQLNNLVIKSEEGKELIQNKHLSFSNTKFQGLKRAEKTSWQPPTPAEFFTPTPLETIAIDIPEANPISHIINSRHVKTPTTHENTKWTDIRLKTMNSKWEKEGWENKKIPSAKDRKSMSSKELNALVIETSMQKLRNLKATDKTKDKYTNIQDTEVQQALDAKIHLYVNTNWNAEEKLTEKNVLTISKDGNPIFEIRPEENKIQFLISDVDLTAEHRVVALEMFQQMCRIKGSPQEVKINCENSSMKEKFTENAARAGIKAVAEFNNKPSKPNL